MEREPQPPEPKEIPKELHSFYEDRPFRCCTRCGESLAHFEEGYQISKQFKDGEVIMEFALCAPCLQSMMDEMSEESKQTLHEFHEENAKEETNLNECCFCDVTREGCKGNEFSLLAACAGEDLYDGALVCGECTEKMQDLMSEETRKLWDRFREENFPGIPADFEPVPIGSSPSPLSV